MVPREHNVNVFSMSGNFNSASFFLYIACNSSRVRGSTTLGIGGGRGSQCGIDECTQRDGWEPRGWVCIVSTVALQLDTSKIGVVGLGDRRHMIDDRRDRSNLFIPLPWRFHTFRRRFALPLRYNSNTRSPFSTQSFHNLSGITGCILFLHFYCCCH